MLFMQDGAPPHYKLEVRRWLNERFPGRWIGRLGSARVPTPIVWPANSPDLTPCDFFLWGFIKEGVYRRGVPRDLAELERRIRYEFNSLPQAMTDRAIDSFEG